ncbi:ParB/RepB/Spo0J family partition protein [Kitasatospora acidiphila]|uniref:ParB/RepB/Spo0J family partition protein n=1 Tax=Kitasatospora acidiphila TaxID=2567942 RepID=A0A540WFX9_9ACTN|nr:ParB/RepB/Spo0J family partition protein [Kitasatospora acidiphila]TQF07930.1 ParB/RepB/Spo0J family partition protein [Kitasatospora acidiphila]
MSSRVADRLGAGSFGAARPPRSERGRAKAVTEGTIPAYDLVRLPLATVAPCPVNPRRNFGTDEDKNTLGTSLAARQTTACVAVTRAAYLKLWPDHDQILDPAGAEYVLLNGERRYRSALHVGLDTLDFVVRDDLAGSPEDFLDNLLLENEDRTDFDIIERAQGIKQLLEACAGNAAEVARRRGKDRSWVGNQVALLTLPGAIQERLVSGQLAERWARRLARALKDDPSLGTDDLLALADQLQEEERARRDEDRKLRALAKAGVLSADNTPAAPAAQAQSPADGVPDSHGTPAVTEQRTPAVSEAAQARLLSADNNRGSAAPTAPPESRGDAGSIRTSTEEPAELPTPRVPAVEPQRIAPDTPDWRDPNGVAGWICKFLSPVEAKAVAEAVLAKVAEAEAVLLKVPDAEQRASATPAG